MPFTFLAHQAPLLPAKRAWPHAVDGVALVAGSMMPDLLYVTNGMSEVVDGHSWLAQLYVCLPLALVVAYLVRGRVVAVLAPHLPDLGGFHVHDYATIAAGRHAWPVVAGSALAGSVSHLVMDAFTHPHGWVVRHWSALSAPILVVAGRQVAVHKALQWGGHLFGSLAAVMMLWAIGRRRLLLRWHGGVVDAGLRPTVASRRRLAVWVAVGVVAGAIAGVAVHRRGAPAALMALCWMLFGGLVIGCFRAAPRMARW